MKNSIPEGIKKLQDQLISSEKYWRDWNGRAANRGALLEGENKRLRQRVAELEAELNEWTRSDLVERNERLEKALLKKNAQYKERGERMKEMRQQIPYRYWKQWFDKKGKGEPL